MTSENTLMVSYSIRLMLYDVLRYSSQRPVSVVLDALEDKYLENKHHPEKTLCLAYVDFTH